MISKNGSEIPLGLGMALIQNTEAFFRFSKLDAASQQRVIDGVVVEPGAIVRHAILGENSRVCKNAVVGGAYAPGEEMLISVTSKGAVVEENAVLRPGDMM